MLEGIRDILIICTPQDLQKFREFFGDGRGFGLNFPIKNSPSQRGLLKPFIIGEEFIGEDSERNNVKQV